jgi:hypothetical protein
MQLSQDISDTDFDIVIQNGMPVYPHSPADADDYDKTNYAGNYGSVSTVGMCAPGGWVIIELNAAGIALLNKTGYNKFMLRSSRDIAGTAPGVGAAEYIRFNVGTAVLCVEHSAGPSSVECVAVNDGYIPYGNNNYNTCRNAVNGDTLQLYSLAVGQVYDMFFPPNYHIYRGLPWFDTRNVPTPSAIKSGYLALWVEQDYSDDDFDIVLQKGNGIAPHRPFVLGDYDRTPYSGNGGSLNTAGLVFVPNPTIIPLNATGLSWINYGGYTSFVLRSQKDIDGTAPFQTEYVIFQNSTAANPTYKPVLVLVYQSGRELIAPPAYSLTWEAGSFGR